MLRYPNSSLERSIDIWIVKNDNKISNSICQIRNSNKNYMQKKNCVFRLSSHFVLRNILSKYVGESILYDEFQFNKFGKPLMPSKTNYKSWHFNLSYSKECILIAVAKGTKLGVDIEKMEHSGLLNDMVKISMHDQERRVWAELDVEKKLLAFYSNWTRKESLLKYIGIGLSYDPTRILVGFQQNRKRTTFRFKNKLIHSFFSTQNELGCLVYGGNKRSVYFYHASLRDLLCL